MFFLQFIRAWTSSICIVGKSLKGQSQKVQQAVLEVGNQGLRVTTPIS